MPRPIRTNKTLLAESILWLEGEGNYTRIHRQAQPVEVSAYTLKRFEERFNGFLRVRRNALVNPVHIEGLRRTSCAELVVLLSDGTVLPVSRRRYHQVIAQVRQGF